ncbi:hypothetical protein QBC43DRAFT_241255 [Cladorrhinum sp. PSN259]|nr:hypothetical protein QBC43DRAFT_241255 [Cladorrhinum sp. PSN259]
MDMMTLDPALRSSNSNGSGSGSGSQNANTNVRTAAHTHTSASSSSAATAAPAKSNISTTASTTSSHQHGSPPRGNSQLPHPTQEELRRDWNSLATTQGQASPTAPRNTVSIAHHHHQTLPPIQNAPQPQASLTGPPQTTSSAAFSPQTPNHPVTTHSPENSNNNNTDPKKPRACESCRSLKVRCDPDPSDPEGACKRCKKAKRECVITQPTRKRQKKTDSRVAELEKKIDALTQSLVATRSTASSVQQHGVDAGHAAGERVEGALRFDQVTLAQLHFVRSNQQQGQGQDQGQGGVKRKVDDYLERERERDTPQSGSGIEERGSIGSAVREADVVDREVISMGMARELFLRYTMQMCQHLPGVVFPVSLTVTELRATKPILFLSIMAAASSEMPGLQKVLTKELMQVFAEKIIVDGQKSLELVQALQVAVIWYWPPERFEELKFYQLVHVAAVMAIEIGLGRKKQARGGFKRHIANAWKDHPMHKAPPDPTTLEARRAWLTCYFLATNTSMALHRANLIRWTPFMAECMDVLESSPEAVPTDKYFCHLVWTHKLAEEVGIQFSMDDPAYTPNIADLRTQHALRGFERELERYSSSIPSELQQPSLKMSFHVISLYMHEIATHNGDGPEDFRLCNALAGGSDNILGSETPLSPAHINALSACLIAIDGIFDVFLSLDIKTIRCLPVFNFVRVAYAVVVLIKLYFAASSVNSELGKVINKDNMKVEQHLDGLLEKFKATAADDRSRPAAKFLVVLIMLRSWFQKQKQDQGKDETPSSASYPPSRQGEKDLKTPTPVPSQQQQQQQVPPQPPQGYNVTPSMATTPLELLSEMAAASAGNNTNPTATVAAAPTPRSLDVGWINRQMMYDTASIATPAAAGGTPQQQQQDAAANSTPSVGPPPPSADGTAAPFHPLNNSHNQGMPWLFGTQNNPFSGLEFDYTNLGDGFAQAMDMTLGGFMDGAFTSEDGMKYAFDDTTWYPPSAGLNVSIAGTGNGVGAGVGTGGGGYGF